MKNLKKFAFVFGFMAILSAVNIINPNTLLANDNASKASLIAKKKGAWIACGRIYVCDAAYDGTCAD